MPLESLQPNAKTDIRRMSVESPEKVEFQDIGLKPGDFELMKENLEKYKEGKEWYEYGYRLYEMKKLFPERSHELDIDIKFEAQESLLKKYNDSRNSETKIVILMMLKNSWKIDITKLDEYQDFKNNADDYIKGWIRVREKNPKNFMEFATDIKLVFPEFEDALNLDDEYFETLKGWLKTRKNLPLRELSNIRLLYPKKYEQDLKATAIKLLKKDKAYKKYEIYDKRTFTALLGHMLYRAILLADDIKFSNYNFELVFVDDLDKQEQTDQLPIKKDF